MQLCSNTRARMLKLTGFNLVHISIIQSKFQSNSSLSSWDKGYKNWVQATLDLDGKNIPPSPGEFHLTLEQNFRSIFGESEKPVFRWNFGLRCKFWDLDEFLCLENPNPGWRLTRQKKTGSIEFGVQRPDCLSGCGPKINNPFYLLSWMS